MACFTRFRRSSCKRSGFSLMELALALVAVGLVVGMTTKVMNTKTVSATDNEAAIKKCYSDTRVAMTTMNNALQQFFLKNGYYPMPLDNSGNAVAFTPPYTGAIVDDATTPKLVIGRFPYKTVGLPQKYEKDCFGNNGVAIAGYNSADAYYRYSISLDSTGNKSNYSKTNTHGAVTVATSPSVTLNSKAAYGIVSHGSTGCSGTLTTGKTLNCATSFTAASPYKLANFAFSRKAGDSAFFDDLTVVGASNDSGCGAGTVNWIDASTNLTCTTTTTTAVKANGSVAVSTSLPLTKGTGTAKCTTNASGAYDLKVTGSCQCDNTVPNGTVAPVGGVCTLTCDAGYMVSGNSCVLSPCSPASVANGTVAAAPACTITCDSGYTLSGTSCVANGATVTLTANPTNIAAGGSTTLTWTSTNATSCTLSSTDGTYNNTSEPTSSAGLTVTPAATTTYSMTCTGAGGSSTPSTITITVGAATCPVVANASSNGTYPSCTPTCNSGYTLQNGSCVASPTPCSPASVANGTVAAAPACTITCDPGYTLNGTNCVSTTSVLASIFENRDGPAVYTVPKDASSITITMKNTIPPIWEGAVVYNSKGYSVAITHMIDLYDASGNLIQAGIGRSTMQDSAKMVSNGNNSGYDMIGYPAGFAGITPGTTKTITINNVPANSQLKMYTMFGICSGSDTCAAAQVHGYDKQMFNCNHYYTDQEDGRYDNSSSIFDPVSNSNLWQYSPYVPCEDAHALFVRNAGSTDPGMQSWAAPVPPSTSAPSGTPAWKIDYSIELVPSTTSLPAPSNGVCGSSAFNCSVGEAFGGGNFGDLSVSNACNTKGYTGVCIQKTSSYSWSCGGISGGKSVGGCAMPSQQEPKVKCLLSAADFSSKNAIVNNAGSSTTLCAFANDRKTTFKCQVAETCAMYAGHNCTAYKGAAVTSQICDRYGCTVNGSVQCY